MTTYLFDVRFARPSALDGVGRHLWSTAAALPAALHKNESLTLLVHVDDVVAWSAQVPGARVIGSELPIASFAQQLHWPALVASIAPDLVHYPQYDLPAVPTGIAAVATVYDLTPVDEPRYFGSGAGWRRVAAAALLAGSCARAARVVTLSHASARAIAAHAPQCAGRVRVTTPGPSHLALTTSTPVPVNSDRFIYVGNHRPHKRVEVLVRAFAEVRRRRPQAELLLVGRSDARFPEVPRLLRGPLGEGVRQVESASDADVAALLSSSAALVFASVGEGYGFPVVEALGLGIPAIVADAGSLPEVLDGAGVVVAAADERAWAEAMLRLCTDAALRASLCQRAAQVVSGLDWQATARQTVGVWREALL